MTVVGDTRRRLLDYLRRNEERLEEPGPYVDMPAVLWALAGVESNFDLDAVGDDGDSVGLWQIHEPVWGELDDTDLISVEYQFQAVQPVIRDATEAVKLVAQRYATAPLVNMDDVVGFYPIVWKFGSTRMRQYLDQLGPGEVPMPPDFRRWARDQFGKDDVADHRRRQRTFKRLYHQAYEQDEYPFDEAPVIDIFPEPAKARGNLVLLIVIGGVAYKVFSE